MFVHRIVRGRYGRLTAGRTGAGAPTFGSLAVLLVAAKFGVPVCPHAGGVGVCEYVQHLAASDHIAVSGSLEDRVIEYVDHLHEHFVTPVVIRAGRYVPPTTPGYCTTMLPVSLERYTYPTGAAWTGEALAGTQR